MQVEDYTGDDAPKKSQKEEKQTSNQAALSAEAIELIKSLNERIEQLEKQKSATASESTDTKLLRELVSQIKGGDADSGYTFKERYLAPHEIDVDDQLPREKWKTYITHRVGYVIVDDKRQGIPIRVPYGPIQFQFDSVRRMVNGKEQDVVNISRYTCKSKKEMEFLESHSNYRTIFFDNIKGGKNVDAGKSVKLISAMSFFKNLGIHDLIPYANRFEIDTTLDINTLRAAIAEAQVNEQVEAEKVANELRVNESLLEKEALNK
jgi:hypothetical protein